MPSGTDQHIGFSVGPVRGGRKIRETSQQPRRPGSDVFLAGPVVVEAAAARAYHQQAPARGAWAFSGNQACWAYRSGSIPA